VVGRSWIGFRVRTGECLSNAESPSPASSRPAGKREGRPRKAAPFSRPAPERATAPCTCAGEPEIVIRGPAAAGGKMPVPTESTMNRPAADMSSSGYFSHRLRKRRRSRDPGSNAPRLLQGQPVGVVDAEPSGRLDCPPGRWKEARRGSWRRRRGGHGRSKDRERRQNKRRSGHFGCSVLRSEFLSCRWMKGGRQ
jgi:hypothetical protein